MKKRLFIAIDLPKEAKERLIKIQKKFKKLNLHWTKEKNLHFTIVFIGWTEEEKVKVVERIVKKAVQGLSPFLLKLEKVILGPDNKRPRMLWAVGSCPSGLNKLKKTITEGLKKEGIQLEDKHPLKMHITLARARKKELFGRKIEEGLNLIFPAKEICLMESKLKTEGVEYTILENISLSKK